MKILKGIKLILNDQGIHLDSNMYNQFGIIQVLQISLILQTSNWSGTFFAVSYSKPALISELARPTGIFYILSIVRLKVIVRGVSGVTRPFHGVVGPLP